MRLLLLVVFLCHYSWGLLGQGSRSIGSLPTYTSSSLPPTDWLLDNSGYKAEVYQADNQKSIVLSNGLLRRSIRIRPNAATFDFVNLTTNEQFIRAVRPEASLVLNGKTHHIGGLYGQKEQAYLTRDWLEGLTPDPKDFAYVGIEVKALMLPIAWKPTTWATQTDLPTGKELILFFRSSDEALKGLTVRVHYALYDGMPLLSKWVTVTNEGNEPIRIDQITNEWLAVHEEESSVVGETDKMKRPQRLFIENDYAFNNAMRYELSDQATHWKADTTYTSQVNYYLNTPCELHVYPAGGIGVSLRKGEQLRSVRSYELLLDGYDRERNGLARRYMYRQIAPWTTQNPIFMHLISTDPATVRNVIDQCATTGYEMVILSFGSGLNMEDTSAITIAKYKALADYAHQKGIKLGGYSLFSSRSIGPETDVIDPVTGLPNKGAQFGQAPCLASQWGMEYLQKIKRFIQLTGFDLLEHDGPYPGDLCASTTHAGHRDLADSRWIQMELQKKLYQDLNQLGVYINAPDWYFLDGSHKIAIGYREVNFSLPRDQQKILNRQNIYDGTWEKTPSMGWGFVPLTRYQGGGAEAILEPLSEHLADYKQLMIQYYGAGVQACYRGPRLYDTEATLAVVKEVITWYKTYRMILNSDIIHLRRADGRDWDGILHINPRLKEKGFAMLYNPLNEPIKRTIKLPLYYAGLTQQARIREKEGKPKSYRLNRLYEAEVEVTIPAQGYTWLIVE